jgi:hypothetical protein
MTGGFVDALVLAAQAPVTSPEAASGAWSNLPGAIILLIPLAIAGALYISSRLAKPDPSRETVRREGAVSRTLENKAAD